MHKQEFETQVKSLLGEKEFQNYKKFAFRDDMFKLTIGVMLGNSFNKVVYGISDYLVMPLFTFLLSYTGDEWRQWTFKPIIGLNFEVGRLLAVLVDFTTTSIILYLIYTKALVMISKENSGPNTKKCEYCCGAIDENAKKCPLCTGDLIVKARRNRRKNTRTKNNRGQ
jgi:large conductance mechanosensitive channel